MASNATVTPATQPGTDFTSPVFILPLAISLAALVAIIVAVCVVYRKRQRKRTEELTRRLRVTERRIDAIGTLKEQKLATRKADNLQCEREPSMGAAADTTSGKGTRNPNFWLNRTEEETEKGTALPVRDRTRETNVAGVRLGRESVHTTSYPSHLAYYSACKGSTAVHSQPAAAHAQAQEVANSSMAVECETIPAVSSLSTIQTGINPLWFAAKNAANFWPTGGFAGGEEGRPNTPVSCNTTTMEETSTTRTDERSGGQVEKWV